MRFVRVVPFLLLFSVGCASVHSFHQEPFDVDAKGTLVAYEAEHTVWFRFDNDTSWVQAAQDHFLAQCPSGKIEGVSSRLSTLNSFMHWNYHLRLAGTCKVR